MELNTLIERISYLRIRANLSARKLSLMIGKNAGYIHMLEQNKNFAPTFETLSAILDACNSSTEEFFYYDIEEYKKDSQIIERLKKIKDDEKKTAIITLLDK
ncbi:MAG: helix-turn-helix domain-containing protein [Clostridiales bacterium]|nr:helix-turn-helix domain-containing protein [Clostridiales bacterium]